MAFAVAGCPQKHEAAADAAASASAPTASASAPPPAPVAANEGDVKQYPDQQKIDNVPAEIAWYVANVRSDASSGASLISVLKKGASTTKIAQKSDFYLITFTEPSAPGRKLMGWVDAKAYTPQVWDAGKQCIGCGKGQVSIMLEGGHQQCVILCDSSNDQCPTAQVCKGDAPKCVKGDTSDNIEFCIPGNKGTTPVVPTASGSATPPTPSASATPDAGASTAKKAFAHAADAGPCPAGFIQAGNFCRAKCTVATAATDCVAGAACKSFQGQFGCADGL